MFFFNAMKRSAHFYFHDAQCIGKECWKPGIRVTTPDYYNKHIFGHRILKSEEEVCMCTNWFDHNWVCPYSVYDEFAEEERIRKGWRSSVW